MKKPLSENRALAKLQRIKSAYRRFIKTSYEHAAEDCQTCPTPGACCTDAHFVNVQITRLEALAIRETLARTPRLTDEKRRRIYRRARAAVERYHLTFWTDTFQQTYSCPLFEPGVGCIVHRRAKPAPCIQHACYKDWRDLPPEHLQKRTEHRVEQLNKQVYGDQWNWLPIPLWLSLIEAQDQSEGTLAALGSHKKLHRAGRLNADDRTRRRSLPVIQSLPRRSSPR